ALSEAMEQVADLTRKWNDEIAKFVETEADKLSANDYKLADLVTAPVELMRIWVRNSIQAADVISGNLALISQARSSAAPQTRKMNVPVSIPPDVDVKLLASDLVGRSGYRIRSSRLQVAPESFGAEAATRDVVVEVTVDCSHAPADLYEGLLYCSDPTVSAPFGVAISELGEPLR
ncbi:MAG: hypothetical protein ACRDTX_25785, partial [Pseudonocardiaceae bacterium]